jgi:hypothetical protein
MRYLSLGSVSHGTLLCSDLIPEFLDVLESVAPSKARTIRKARSNREIFDWLDNGGDSGEEPEDAFELVSELEDALDAYCAPYTHFSTHEGDGSDFGVWVSWESLEEDAREGEVIKVNAGEPCPKDTKAQYIWEVNDHGNSTLKYRSNGRIIWEVV